MAKNAAKRIQPADLAREISAAPDRSNLAPCRCCGGWEPVQEMTKVTNGYLCAYCASMEKQK